VQCTYCPAGSTSAAGAAVCTQCRAGCSSVAGAPAGCQPCPAGQTSLAGGVCFNCNGLLPNGNFSIDVTGSSAIQCALALRAHARAAGRPASRSACASQSTQKAALTPTLRRNWTVLVETPRFPGTWYLSSGGTSFAADDPITDPPNAGSGQFAVTGQTGPSAYALVSAAFPVSVRMSLQLDYFVITTAAYATPAPIDNLSYGSFPNQQARLPERVLLPALTR